MKFEKIRFNPRMPGAPEGMIEFFRHCIFNGLTSKPAKWAEFLGLMKEFPQTEVDEDVLIIKDGRFPKVELHLIKTAVPYNAPKEMVLALPNWVDVPTEIIRKKLVTANALYHDEQFTVGQIKAEMAKLSVRLIDYESESA